MLIEPLEGWSTVASLTNPAKLVFDECVERVDQERSRRCGALDWFVLTLPDALLPACIPPEPVWIRRSQYTPTAGRLFEQCGEDRDEEALGLTRASARGDDDSLPSAARIPSLELVPVQESAQREQPTRCEVGKIRWGTEARARLAKREVRGLVG